MVQIHAALFRAESRGKNRKGVNGMAEKTVRGTVKWFSARRGYGFITDEDGTDYFVHFSELQMEGFKKVQAGQAVAFEIGKSGDGRVVAQHVVPEGEPPAAEEK